MELILARTLLVPLIADNGKMEATILENQMEKKMENEMETGIIYQDPPCTLNWGYMVPNSGYLSPNRG